MSLLALEINDCGIIAARENSIMLDSPGIALFDEGETLIGEPAARRAFLSPSQANNRFWDELAKTPLPRPFASARTHADLVYAHLRQIWNKLKPGIDGVILAVPGFYDRRQLELLLGISNAMDLPVIGLVDAAVAAGRGADAKRTAAHLELHLHCVALTRLRLDSEVSHAGTETSREVGMASLASTWVKAVARRFVRETRFDPLHYGATEQALHDQLPDVLASLVAQPGAEISVTRGKRRFKISVSREELKADAEHLYARLGALVAPHVASRSPPELLVSARVARLPGLLDQVAALGARSIRVLQPGEAALGAIEQRDAILRVPGNVSLVTRLPRKPGSPMPDTADFHPWPAAGPTPTHLVHRGVAYALDKGRFVLGRELLAGETGLQLTSDSAGISRRHFLLFIEKGRVVLEDQSTYGTFVNDQRVEGSQVLSAGDRIRVGTPGEELQVIVLIKP